MCYKTALDKEADQITKAIGRNFAIPEEFRPSGHLDAFLRPNLYIIPQDSKGLIYPTLWGLIPDFINNDDSKLSPDGYLNKYKTYNARGEEIFEKRSYKESAASQRCLILADGFYEPHHYDGKSQPFFCYLEGRELFAFAGLYTKLDEDLYTTTMITVKANETFSFIHNEKKRMPLVLDQDISEDWISNLNPKQVLEIVEHGFTSEEFLYHPVTNEIYKNRKLDGAKAQKPVEAFDPGFNQSKLF